MELLFKNVTRYDSKAYNKFVKFHNEKYNDNYFFLTIVLSLLLLYCFILNIQSKNFIVGLIFILSLIGFIVYRFYIPVRKYKNNSKEFENDKKILYTFYFYNHYFKIDNEKMYYIKLYKVLETNDYYYLYFNKEYAALVSKKGFKIGNSKDFSKFIKKKCFLKYRCNMSKNKTVTN